MRRWHSAWLMVLAASGVACHHGDPPGANIDASASGLAVTRPDGPGPASPRLSGQDASGGSDDAPPAADAQPLPEPGAIDAGSPTTDAGASLAVPTDDRPGPDEQTRDKPSSTSAAFQRRMSALWDAIAEDNPDLAADAFFPLTAYERVKAISTPARDWRVRLMGNFRRDVHALHAELGRSADRAKFVRVEVPDTRARWIDPGEETNAIGYYRVYGTRIIYEVDGREKSFGISSLISWRGEWYVVHLTGFR